MIYINEEICFWKGKLILAKYHSYHIILYFKKNETFQQVFLFFLARVGGVQELLELWFFLLGYRCFAVCFCCASESAIFTCISPPSWISSHTSRSPQNSELSSLCSLSASHSGTLAWQIPWTEEPGRLQSMGSLGVGHDWATSLSLFTFTHWRRTWQPTPVFVPGESQGSGSLVGCHLGLQSRTRLKCLGSSYLLHTVVYTCQSQFPNSYHPPFPAWCPYTCSLCLCLYFCFANRFLCPTFLDSTYMCSYIIFVFLLLTNFSLYDRL